MIEQGRARSSLVSQVNTLLAELDEQLRELRALLARYLTPIALGVGDLPPVVVVNSRLCDAMSLESNQWIEKDLEVGSGCEWPFFMPGVPSFYLGTICPLCERSEIIFL